MTLEEYFEKYPIQEPREVTDEDLLVIADICQKSLKVSKKDDKTLKRREKIDNYKSNCEYLFDKHFENLSIVDSSQLYKIFNQYCTVTILQYLGEE